MFEPSPNQRCAPGEGIEQFRSPWIAAIFSFLFPGWGQWYNGRLWDGLKFFGAMFILEILNFYKSISFDRNIFISFFFYLGGAAIWGYGMKNAFATAEKINNDEAHFTSKSRLFWLPVIILIALIAFLIISPLIPAGSIVSIGSSKGPGVSAYWVHATVDKPDQNHIIVTYLGGNDSAKVDYLSITVTDSLGNSQAKNLGQAGSKIPPVAGDSVNFTGDFSGRDHIVVMGHFISGDIQPIFDYHMDKI